MTEFRKITAFLRPLEWQNIADELLANGARGMTVTEASGAGRLPIKAKDSASANSPSSAVARLLPRVALEMVVAAEQADATVAALREAMLSGEPGDGKILVSEIERVIRIRTAESGRKAL